MSTARYDNAGKTGTGTTIDNMGSRVKAWVSLNNEGASAAIHQGFNVSSVGDNGVGSFSAAFPAPFANVTYCSPAAATGNAAAYLFCTPYRPSSSYAYQRNWNVASVAGSLTDPYGTYTVFIGDLA